LKDKILSTAFLVKSVLGIVTHSRACWADTSWRSWETTGTLLAKGGSQRGFHKRDKEKQQKDSANNKSISGYF